MSTKNLYSQKVYLNGNVMCFAILFGNPNLIEPISLCDPSILNGDCQICMLNTKQKWDGKKDSCQGQYYTLKPFQMFARYKALIL